MPRGRPVAGLNNIACSIDELYGRPDSSYKRKLDELALTKINYLPNY